MASSAERKLRAAQSNIARAKSQIAQLEAQKFQRATRPQTQKIAEIRGKLGRAKTAAQRQSFQAQLTQALREPATKGGRASKSQDRTIAALKQNIVVFENRAATAFQEVVREKTVKAQAKIKAQKLQAEKQRKAEIARQKKLVADKLAESTRQKKLAADKLVADAQAEKQRKREEEERKKQAEIEKAQLVFQSQEIQQEVKPSFESGEESFVSNLEQKRLDDLERLESKRSLERLEEGTGFFETGPGFEETDDPRLQAGASRDEEGTLFTVKGGEVTEKPIKNILDPSSSEGRFIEGQIQSQLGTDVESFLQTEKVLTAVKTGKASKAAAVFEQTVTPELAEAGTRPGSTILLDAEEAGLGINRPSEGFPGISGDLIADVFSPGEFAELVNAEGQGTAFKVKAGKVSSEPIPPIDPFALAQGEREATGLIPGEPISFGNLLGFDTPPPKKKPTPITSQVFPPSFGSGGLGPIKQPQNTVQSIIDAGFAPTQRPIERGVIPFDQPISTLGKVGKKPPRNIPLLIGGVETTPKIISSFESDFGSFVSNIGADFGFDIGGDFFKSISKSISFERSSSSVKIKSKRKISTRSVEFAKKSALAKKTPGINFDTKTGNFFLSGSPSRFTKAKTFKQAVANKKTNDARIARDIKNAAIRKAKRVREAAQKRASRSRSRAKRKAQKSRARARSSRPAGRVSGSKPKVSKVSRPSKAKRSSSISQTFISSGGVFGRSARSTAIKTGPSGSKKKSKKGKSTPGIFGGGFTRRF